MMPLGITPTQRRQYHERLLMPHDFRVELDILHLDESPKGKLDADFIDGQVNLQRGGGVARTSTFTIRDPGHSLHLDDDTPFEGGVSFNRMVRVRHIVQMPWGEVTAIPFVGPMTKLTREGDIVTLECQDKAIIAMEGRPPMTRRRGYNAVKAIRDFMEATGERHFRFDVPPKIRKRRLHKPHSIGWTRSPWSVCTQIADDLGLQLVYGCDGFLLLRRVPETAAVEITDLDLIGGVKIDYDRANIRNHVRVTGQIPANKKTGLKKPRKFTEPVTARGKFFMAPGRMARNGAMGWLPLVIEDTSIKKHSRAVARAKAELDRATQLQVTASWSTLPFFDLDNGDKIRLTTPKGTLNTPLLEASIPLGLGGDASIGIQKPVSRARRSGRRGQK